RLSSSKGQSHREVATQRDSSGRDNRPRGLLCRRVGTAKTPSIPRLPAIGDCPESSRSGAGVTRYAAARPCSSSRECIRCTFRHLSFGGGPPAPSPQVLETQRPGLLLHQDRRQTDPPRKDRVRLAAEA